MDEFVKPIPQPKVKTATPSQSDSEIQAYKTELKLYKNLADRLGIKYSGNISLDTLKAKVDDMLESTSTMIETAESKKALRKKIKERELKLMRIRLTCLNPMKAAWRGEVFTVANPFIGAIKKFVPYDAKFYVNGYHVPYCIYKMLKRKQFLNISSKDVNGKTVVSAQHVPEFGIEVLPQLTPDELQELATAQQAGNRID